MMRKMNFLHRAWRTIGRRQASPSKFKIELDYPVHASPRYGYGKPLHPLLLQVIEARRSAYRDLLEKCVLYKSEIRAIESKPGGGEKGPQWVNGFLTAFDALTLYVLIQLHRPRLYIEIGSGHSTRFARRAIGDGKLSTNLVSIDPRPRIGTGGIADRVIEQPVETMALEIFESLESGDILFVDNSHRVFTNSDAAVVFLDILPRLRPGVLVHFHDIFLPADYPPEWNGRYYSEQYLLAANLLAPAQSFEIVLANSFISDDPELRSILADIWNHPAMEGVERHGCSFWVRIKE